MITIMLHLSWGILICNRYKYNIQLVVWYRRVADPDLFLLHIYVLCWQVLVPETFICICIFFCYRELLKCQKEEGMAMI